MGGRWNLFTFQLHKVLCAVLLIHLLSDECLSLNPEGFALLQFRARVEVDPYGVFENWDPNDSTPCNWTGVRCIDGNVMILNLKESSLEGVLAPEIGKLSHLRALVLYKNNFSGIIPKEIGYLNMLELLDLRNNNLNGTIPMQIGEMLSLKHLLLCSNKFQGSIPWVDKPNMHSDLIYDGNLSCDEATNVGCLNRKFGHCIWQSGLQKLKKINSFLTHLKGNILQVLDMLPINFFNYRSLLLSNYGFKGGSIQGYEERHGDNFHADFSEPYFARSVFVDTVRRRLLEETSNLAAAPGSSANPKEIVTVPSTGSGSFPAVPSGNVKKKPSPASTSPASPPNIPSRSSKPRDSVENKHASRKGSLNWVYILVLPVLALLLIIMACMIFVCRHKGVATIGPWRTGLSGQLQKAFVTGVPKLNRAELEAACEDFSNIVISYPDYTVFKGTLSSGVEIAVASTAVPSAKEWSKRSEMHFRKKIDTLSRINHKNFVNLIGYCEEDEPFMRMMVFEYSPNGSLYEHLHDEQFDHLDWSARKRIVMGIAYCLQHMHELNPPIAHPDLQSTSIFIADDYAAKVADINIWKEVAAKGKILGDDDADFSESPSSDLASNVYSFGTILLEIISGKVPYSEEQGSLINLAVECLNNNRGIRSMIDLSLKSHKEEELDIICDVIQDCIHEDPKKRPMMKEVSSRLRNVLGISPEAANPRLSPLWWAELEILSVEAS
ncbi:protein MALE DISCOVERER 2-like isoform X1 [Phoenix dactylifera]|uniref:Protein MALE DISCOVERER 2-like isoform X1 n=1 Tax=Phoenix dactylifera TaxID=42345 RepID=A0A8B7C0V5_PHODC|nr:protein MALE DISCOVERER 2-like isoform X1 [Phoenix dactylifera]